MADKKKNLFNKPGKGSGGGGGGASKRKEERSYFAASRKKRNRQLMIVVPALAVLIAIAVYSFTIYSKNVQSTHNANYGPIGSAHVHAAFAVKLNGTQFDFSDPKYQVKSRYLHMENNDGTTLHRHATNVPISEFFRSIKMNVTNTCFTTDNGAKYCNNGKDHLDFYVNGTKVPSIANYVLNDGDRILIAYGENPLQIKQDLDQLRQQPIKS
jgi:flagellar basal body-associated protein FliL